MVALTRDLDVFATRVTTRVPAVFFSDGYITQARYMGTLRCLLIRHFPVLPDHFRSLQQYDF
jgi:hypothetical protein